MGKQSIRWHRAASHMTVRGDADLNEDHGRGGVWEVLSRLKGKGRVPDRVCTV